MVEKSAVKEWSLIKPRQSCAGACCLVGLVLAGQATRVTIAQLDQDTKKVPATEQFEHLRDIPFTGEGIPLTMIHDADERPFLYVATNEGGLHVLNVKNVPQLVRTVSRSDLGGMHVMSLTQAGRRLYLALGNHWGTQRNAGLAVIDVSNPGKASVVGMWKDTETGGGGGAVVVSGDTAYLAAMAGGLIILDVRSPAKIRVHSRLQPDLAFPDARPDRSKINARGLALQENRIYLCYDAGGLRVINVANPEKPVEMGRYSNPAMNGRPRAYNNIVLNGSLAYATVDYVGLEVLDVSNPRAIKLVSWWNPWNPKLEGLRWFSSPGHANEIAYDAKTRTVLMSAGRSDLVAVRVADSARPVQVGGIGEVEDTKATWGLALHGDTIYLSYIRTLGIPFRADWAGVKIYRYANRQGKQ